MTPNIFFIDEFESSKFNGIGTYRDVLLKEFYELGKSTQTLISLNSYCETLEIKRHIYGYEYCVPRVAGGDWRSYGEIITPLLRTYIPDNYNNVFILNHSPCYEFIKSLKSQFPNSKIVFIIHDQGWCSVLNGDSGRLKNIMNNEPCFTNKDIYFDYVKDYCGKEMDIYQNVDMVICLSEVTCKLVKETYKVNEDKVMRIFNGYFPEPLCSLSKSEARHRLNLRNDDELIIFAGRAAKSKGIDSLLMSLNKLVISHPKLRCVLAGNPKGFINYWNLAKPVVSNIIIAGQLNREELSIWYAACDIGVLPSFTEQCSYVALEMMNAGLTIVSSNGHGLAEMFKDNVNALVVPFDYPIDNKKYSDTFTDRICHALDISEETKDKMTRNASYLLQIRYNSHLMAREYINVFENLITKYAT